MNPLQTSGIGMGATNTQGGGGFWNSFFTAIPAIGATIVGALQATKSTSATPIYTGVTPTGGIYQSPYPVYSSASTSLGQYAPLLLIGGIVLIAVVLLKR